MILMNQRIRMVFPFWIGAKITLGITFVCMCLSCSSPKFDECGTETKVRESIVNSETFFTLLSKVDVSDLTNDEIQQVKEELKFTDFKKFDYQGYATSKVLKGEDFGNNVTMAFNYDPANMVLMIKLKEEVNKCFKIIRVVYTGRGPFHDYIEE